MCLMDVKAKRTLGSAWARTQNQLSSCALCYVLSSLNAGGCFSMVSFQECFAGLNNGAVFKATHLWGLREVNQFLRRVYLYRGGGARIGNGDDARPNNAKLFHGCKSPGIPHTSLRVREGKKKHIPLGISYKYCIN